MIYGLIVVLLVAVAAWWLMSRRRGGLAESQRSEIGKRWGEIKIMLNSADEHAQVRAVMEADKLLDQVLKWRGVAGQTMGDRLKNGRGWLGSLEQEVWQAHKLRNRLAHEVDARPNAGQIRRAVESLGRAIGKLAG